VDVSALPQGRSSHCPLNRRLGKPLEPVWAFGRGEIPFILLGIKP